MIEPGITDTGCWTTDDKHFSQHHFDAGLSKAIVSYLKEQGCKTIVDVGCGDGRYTQDFIANGFDAFGIDGNPNTKEITDGLCSVCDVSKPVYFTPQDWVVCLEVGEHIPKEFQDTFIDNLVKLAKDGIILSWAGTGQNGFGHVNCADLEQIKWIVCSKGFLHDDAGNEALRNGAELWWFKSTLMVFKKKKNGLGNV